MSTPSNWPLPPGSIRYVVPRPVIQLLTQHPLSEGLYPQGMGYYREASGHHMERPEHDDHLLIYCLEGGAEVEVPSGRCRVGPGDLLVLPRGTPHSYRARPRKPWTIYWAHFDGNQADSFVRHLSLGEPAPELWLIPLGNSARVVSDFENLLAARQSTYNLDAFINAANQLRAILTYIALLQPMARHQDAGGRFDLERVHSLMQESVHGQLDLAHLAEAVNLSKYHFIKKYKQLTGATPIDHFIRLKIERACQLLDVSCKNISEVAAETGYQDAYYFSRAFKKVMGISPSDYRKMRTGGYA